MEVRLCSHRNLAREFNCSTVTYFPGKITLASWRALHASFLFIILGLIPSSPHLLAKKAHFIPVCSNVNSTWFGGGRGGGGQVASFILVTEELGFNGLDLHCSYFKAIQFSYSYCSNRCLLHIIGCLSSFLLQNLSGSLHQHQPHRSSAPSLSCIYLGPWGMFFFQHRGCHIFLLPCAEYWCRPDT